MLHEERGTEFLNIHSLWYLLDLCRHLANGGLPYLYNSGRGEKTIGHLTRLIWRSPGASTP